MTRHRRRRTGRYVLVMSTRKLLLCALCWFFLKLTSNVERIRDGMPEAARLMTLEFRLEWFMWLKGKNFVYSKNVYF